MASEAAVILVAEDDALVRMVAHDVLSDAGYGVVEAVNATEALALLDNRPDTRLLFTDVEMPGELDGYGLAHVVSKKRPDVAILVTSGNQMPGQADLPPGARFLPKPYSPSALLEAIGELTGRSLDSDDPNSHVPLAPVNMTVSTGPLGQHTPGPVQEPEK